MAFVRLLLAFFIPPLAVFLQFGAGKYLAINVALTLLGFVPGVVHAMFIMASRRPGLARRDNLHGQTRTESGLA